MNIYDIRRYGTAVFFILTITMVGFFLYTSSNLVNDLSRQERERMQIWADATKEIANITMSATDSEAANIDIDFLLSIIEQNHTIPVLLTDDSGEILLHRNFDLPEPVDSTMPYFISDVNNKFLYDKLSQLHDSKNVIHIEISPTEQQHIYYEDSKLLKKLSYYPFVQLLVMLAFIAIVYYAVSSTKRAEQNKVWVGLSKETAHQLGTPISSLMGWIEVLRTTDIEPEYVDEMNKDVSRLSMIASRFSKIGSKPTLEPCDANVVVAHAAEYMATRISSRIRLTTELCDDVLAINASEPLFQWVMENLIKNAVDAMEGSGSITVTTGISGKNAFIHVEDTGKGIPRKNFKNVFNPGFTSKERGWGLGLTLAKRIIEQYHGGKIFVLNSEIGVGTTFAIEIPLAK
ncbi:MAG: sensor histidine kinase [Muribaculaceae bacterium]